MTSWKGEREYGPRDREEQVRDSASKKESERESEINSRCSTDGSEARARTPEEGSVVKLRTKGAKRSSDVLAEGNASEGKAIGWLLGMRSRSDFRWSSRSGSSRWICSSWRKW